MNDTNNILERIKNKLQRISIATWVVIALGLIGWYFVLKD